MLNREDWLMIREMRAKGFYIRDIAARVGKSERTVRRALQRGGPPPKRKAGRRRSKLDPYKERVDALLAEGVWNAVVILAKIREAGYEGGISILRDYIRPKRALRKSRATVRFETAPGRQLQHDWGEKVTVIGGEERKIFFAVNTLGYSRRFHAWATDSCDAEHTYESLIRSFEWFGGVPAEVLVDNQKPAVLHHGADGRVRFNRGFLQMAEHYGFRPRACRPRRAQTKGKDERMVGYVKGNFFQRYRAFESFAHLNNLLERWLLEVADLRVQSTVREVVAERFERERPHLQALPPIRFDTAYRETRRVALDAFIDVRGNRYSVPGHLAGERVVVRIGLDGWLRVYDALDHLVAKHRLRPSEEGWQVIPEHHARLWRDLRVETRDLRQYEEVGSWN